MCIHFKNKEKENLIEEHKKNESFNISESFRYKNERNFYYNELKNYKKMQSILLEKYNNLMEQTHKILVPTQCKIKNYSGKSPIYFNNSNDVKKLHNKLMNKHPIEIYNTVEKKDIIFEYRNIHFDYDDIINKKLGLNFNKDGFQNYKLYDKLSNIIIKFNFKENK
jgi:hypothetical protein